MPSYTAGQKLYFKKNPWIKQALNRDNHLCTSCSSDKNIIVHYIDNSGILKEKNSALNNLITLCRPCHADIHHWGVKYSNLKKDNILEMRSQGKTFKEIANYFGVSRQRIYQIYKKLQR